jgi:Prephenate dehydratase
MDLSQIRQNIDSIDDQIKDLFEKRMNLASEVADYKRQNNMPVLNTKREREIISRVTEGQDDTLAGYTKILYTTLFDLSRSFQNRKLNADSALIGQIRESLQITPNVFPASAVVACQGTEGAYSQLACDKLFSRPNIMYFGSFQGVFGAVEKGMCKYGILPIENSLYGSVTNVYDLMKKYKFHIAKSIKLHINHVLLAKQGVKLSEIKEIYSHEQAIGQCSEFLKDLPNVKITVCENTAVAAKTVADSDRRDVAAISSKNCAELYGLCILSESVQNNDSNYTRFICITKDLEIFPGSSKISLMFTIPHRPGSLYGLISKFSALGVNLTKLESRPIPGKDFEFMFYFDMDASVYSDDVMSLLAELENSPEQFMFLGSYSEL